ncbi:hypothetical protein [Marimonas lutisalis]|uniref:hypothetical protein n=1 Tax=Marimonas lutisalis TaxID=2545756 RepID=UPI0010F8EFD8|nr:hypothetical protein [Marimonas lutisalis]
MGHEKLRIADIRYNPEREGFEALVTIHDGGLSYRYPAYVAAPVHADYRMVIRGLTEKAEAAHKSGKPGLRMHLRPLVSRVPAPQDMPPLAA